MPLPGQDAEMWERMVIEPERRKARLAALREVREHFMAWHRLELGLLICGSLEANAVTKIFALFINQIDELIKREEGK